MIGTPLPISDLHNLGLWLHNGHSFDVLAAKEAWDKKQWVQHLALFLMWVALRTY